MDELRSPYNPITERDETIYKGMYQSGGQITQSHTMSQGSPGFGNSGNVNVFYGGAHDYLNVPQRNLANVEQSPMSNEDSFNQSHYLKE